MERVVGSQQERFQNSYQKPISKEIFIQEQSALINITHPNVIRLIDFSITKSPVLIC